MTTFEKELETKPCLKQKKKLLFTQLNAAFMGEIPRPEHIASEGSEKKNKGQAEPSRREFLRNALKATIGAGIVLGMPKEIGREFAPPQESESLQETKETEKPSVTAKEIVESFKGKYRVSSIEEMERLAIKDRVEHSFLEVRAGDEMVVLYLGKGNDDFAVKVELEDIAKRLPQGVTEITLWHTHPTKPEDDLQIYDKKVEMLIKEGLAEPPPLPPSYYDTDVGLADEINFRKLRPEVSLKQGVQDNVGRWRVDIDPDSDLLKEELYKQFTDAKKALQDSITPQERAMLKRIENNEQSGNSAELQKIRSSEMYKAYSEKFKKIRTPNYQFFSGFIYEANLDDRYSILTAWEKDLWHVGSSTKEAIDKFIKKYKEKYKVTITYETKK